MAFNLPGFGEGSSGEESPLNKRPRGRGLVRNVGKNKNSRTYSGGKRRYKKSGSGIGPVISKNKRRKISNKIKDVFSRDKKRKMTEEELIALRDDNRRKRELKKEKVKDMPVASLETKKVQPLDTDSPKVELKRSEQVVRPREEIIEQPVVEKKKVVKEPVVEKPKYDSSKYDDMFGDPSDYEGNYSARRSTTLVGHPTTAKGDLDWTDESPVTYSRKQALSYKGNNPLPFKGRKNKKYKK